MSSNTLTKETAVGLKVLDEWLIDNMHNQGESLVMRCREIITKIQNNGYYSIHEKDLLNELRCQYLESIKEK